MFTKVTNLKFYYFFMSNKLVIVLSLILLHISFNLIGQNDFLPGYIVKNNKDTINGYIESKTDAELIHSINFKKDFSEVDFKTFESSELSAFRFDNGRNFKRFKIADGTQDSSYVFAKKKLGGKIDMWILREKRINPDFLLRNNENLKFAHIKKDEEQIIKEKGKNYSFDKAKYFGAINFLLDGNIPNGLKKIRYSERKISKVISKYNSYFDYYYPPFQYEENLKFLYDISIGAPVRNFSGQSQFRASILRRKMKIERTNKFSFLVGLTYRAIIREKKPVRNRNVVAYEKDNHIFNIIPFGVHYQGKTRLIIPYVYAGIGLCIYGSSSIIVDEFEEIGKRMNYFFFPKVTIGTGFKVKIKNRYIFTEINPALMGSTFSIGLSI